MPQPTFPEPDPNFGASHRRAGRFPRRGPVQVVSTLGDAEFGRKTQEEAPADGRGLLWGVLLFGALPYFDRLVLGRATDAELGVGALLALWAAWTLITSFRSHGREAKDSGPRLHD